MGCTHRLYEVNFERPYQSFLSTLTVLSRDLSSTHQGPSSLRISTLHLRTLFRHNSPNLILHHRLIFQRRCGSGNKSYKSVNSILSIVSNWERHHRISRPQLSDSGPLPCIFTIPETPGVNGAAPRTWNPIKVTGGPGGGVLGH